MIILRIKGGIGNQLFSYAAARSLSIRLNMPLVIDNVSGFISDKLYKRTFQLDHFNVQCPLATSSQRLEPFSRIRRRLLCLKEYFLHITDKSYIKERGMSFDPLFLEIKPKNRIYLDGYWQSEKYFNHIQDVIRNDLRIKPPVDAINEEMAKLIRLRISICIHFRFFDDKSNFEGNNISYNYYHQAIAIMKEKFPTAHYFIFSDNPSFIDSYLGLSVDQVTHVNHNRGDQNAYADLWLMTLCQHFIIANSTFSWWGAWLSSNADKYVVAPDCIISGSKMMWGFEGLIPDNWIKVLA